MISRNKRAFYNIIHQICYKSKGELSVTLPVPSLASAMEFSKKASEIVATLDLKPHPEGGFYSETFRDPSISLSRSQLPPSCTLSLPLSPFFFRKIENLGVLIVFVTPCVIDKVDRAVSSAIYFLLPSGGIAHLHRIPCAETWHYYAGEPLTV